MLILLLLFHHTKYLHRDLRARVSASISFTSSSSKFGLLCLPHGSDASDLASLGIFHDIALRNGSAWYDHVNGASGFNRMTVNGSLYLVTGCDKSSSWGVASFSSASGQCEISLTFSACQVIEGNVSVAYSWERPGTVAVRESQRCNVDVAPRKKNQCSFIRGFKITVREGPLSKLKNPVKVSPIDRNKPEKFIGSRHSRIPGFEHGSPSLLGPPLNTFSKGSPPGSDDSEHYDSVSHITETESGIESLLERSKVLS
jgi:hypothetical protein